MHGGNYKSQWWMNKAAGMDRKTYDKRFVVPNNISSLVNIFNNDKVDKAMHFQSIGPLGRCFLLFEMSICLFVCVSVHF